MTISKLKPNPVYHYWTRLKNYSPYSYNASFNCIMKHYLKTCFWLWLQIQVTKVAVFVVNVFYVLLYPTRLAVWFFSVVDETRRKNSPSNFCWMTFDLWPFWRKNVDDENSHSNGPNILTIASLLVVQISRQRHRQVDACSKLSSTGIYVVCNKVFHFSRSRPLLGPHLLSLKHQHV